MSCEMAALSYRRPERLETVLSTASSIQSRPQKQLAAGGQTGLRISDFEVIESDISYPHGCYWRANGKGRDDRHFGTFVRFLRAGSGR